MCDAGNAVLCGRAKCRAGGVAQCCMLKCRWVSVVRCEGDAAGSVLRAVRAPQTDRDSQRCAGGAVLCALCRWLISSVCA